MLSVQIKSILTMWNKLCSLNKELIFTTFHQMLFYQFLYQNMPYLISSGKIPK